MTRSAYTRLAQSLAQPYSDSSPGPPSGISADDWDALFNAATARLRSIVDKRPAGTPYAPAHEATVLECVAALNQLHVELAFERAGRFRLEAESVVARTALTRALAELAGTDAEELRARRLVPHEDLSSLPDGSFLRERIDRRLASAGPQRLPLAVLYLDLDGFKQINDTHGLGVGDEVLRIVAARLGRVVRAGDTIGRLGGDEFVCLLANLPNLEQLSHLACKLFDAVATPLQIGELSLSVRASIGIATFPAHGATAATLLKSADTAMYRAKREQTGYAFFDEGPQSSFFAPDGEHPEGRPGSRQLQGPSAHGVQ